MRGVALAGEVVLVVDDEHYIVDLLADLLEEEGYQVRRAYDGLAALTEIEREVPDLVIADIMMPRLDGLQLVARLRQQHAGIPVILMSAAVASPRQPGTVFVAKPFDIDDILAIVSRVVHSGNGTR